MVTFSYLKARIVLIFIFSIFYVNTNAEPLYQDCYDSFGTYNILSDYGANIDDAITQLATLASTSYFNKISVGKGSDKVNALFSCRYDITSDDCQSCVQSALENVPFCFRSIDSAQFYQDCTVRYSNSTIFTVMEYLPRYSIHSIDIVEDDGEFIQLLSETVTSLISETVTGFSSSSRYFATTTADYSVLKTLYALAQCNEDLSAKDCKQCLQIEFGNFTSNYPGAFLGQIFTPSCRLSYKLSDVPMSEPYDFTIRIVDTLPGDDLTSPPPMSTPDESGLTPPPSESLSPPFSSMDEELTPPPLSSSNDGFSGLRSSPSSSGTREMRTTLTSYFIALLCIGILLLSSL